jgi:hypothetical protein
MQSETKVRKHMGRTRWWLATEVMVKNLGDANSRRRRGCWQGMITIAEERTCVDPGGYRVTTVRQNMGRTLWWLATEVMVKILGDDNSRRRRGCEGWI